MKCLIEHVKLLVARGHKVIAVHRSDTANTAMPPWTTVQASADIVCGLHQRLGDVYPASEIDVVVVGIFHQVQFASPAKYIIAATSLVLPWHAVNCWCCNRQHHTVLHHSCRLLMPMQAVHAVMAEDQAASVA